MPDFPSFYPGQHWNALQARDMQHLVDCVKRSAGLIGGPGIIVSNTPSGQVVSLARPALTGVAQGWQQAAVIVRGVPEDGEDGPWLIVEHAIHQVIAGEWTGFWEGEGDTEEMATWFRMPARLYEPLIVPVDALPEEIDPMLALKVDRVWMVMPFLVMQPRTVAPDARFAPSCVGVEP